VRKIFVLPILVVLIFAILSHNAYAVTYTISDSSSCQAAPVSGTWNSDTSTCTITNLTLNPDDMLTVSTGITLAVNGIINNNYGDIDNAGTINNTGTINNAGKIDNIGTITNSGTVTNSGSIENDSGGIIKNSLTFNNSGVIIELCGSSITGTVSGAAPHSVACR